MPAAQLAGLTVLALVVGAARLMFTGAIQLPAGAPATASLAAATAAAGAATPGAATPAAVLVVGGWGSSCCDAADGLHAALPGVTVRQFSYTGLDAQGRPRPSGPSADDLPLPELGDLMATQLERLHDLTRRPVDVVAESEGTLGVYAMLDRHPGLPVRSVVLLSPIVDPGQLGYPSARESPGDPGVLPIVTAFPTGHPATGHDQGALRDAADIISSAATAWRMPVTHPACHG